MSKHDLPSRREFLRTAAGTAAAAAGVGALSGSVAASHWEHQKSYVDLVYDETILQRYKPYLTIDHLDREPNALYGWVAISADHDTNVAVYWAEYDQQDGTLPAFFPADSHRGDHEPVYVAFDEATGAVVEVVMSVYHWLRGRYYPSQLHWATAAQQRPLLRPVNPWHQFVPTDEIGADPDLANLKLAFDGWLDNGLEEPLEPGSVVHPWTMLGPNGRQYWWDKQYDAWAVSLGYQFSQLGYEVAGYEKSDTDAISG